MGVENRMIVLELDREEDIAINALTTLTTLQSRYNTSIRHRSNVLIRMRPLHVLPPPPLPPPSTTHPPSPTSSPD